jgi:hypothetical protein
VIKELDPAFDSAIVIWEPRGQDVDTGQAVTIAGDGAVTLDRGLSQTYTTIRVPYAGLDGKRDTYKQQLAVGLANYFLTMRLTPPTPISFNPSPSQYVNCETGQGYALQGGGASSGSDPLYDTRAGVLHDFYSGKLALSEAPYECLGIGARAWAWGGPVTHSGSRPVFTAVERVEALISQIGALRDADMLSRDEARRLEQTLRIEHHALSVGHGQVGRPGLDAFVRQVRALIRAGQLLPHAGALLIHAAKAADACV